MQRIGLMMKTFAAALVLSATLATALIPVIEEEVSMAPVVTIEKCDKSRAGDVDGVWKEGDDGYGLIVSVSNASPGKKVMLLGSVGTGTDGTAHQCGARSESSVFLATAATAEELTAANVKYAGNDGTATFRVSAPSCTSHNYVAISRPTSIECEISDEAAVMDDLVGVQLIIPGSFADTDRNRDHNANRFRIMQGLLEEHFKKGTGKTSIATGFDFSIAEDMEGVEDGAFVLLVRQEDWVQANLIFKDLRDLFTHYEKGTDLSNTLKRDHFNDRFWNLLKVNLATPGGLKSGEARKYLTYLRQGCEPDGFLVSIYVNDDSNSNTYAQCEPLEEEKQGIIDGGGNNNYGVNFPKARRTICVPKPGTPLKDACSEVFDFKDYGTFPGVNPMKMFASCVGGEPSLKDTQITVTVIPGQAECGDSSGLSEETKVVSNEDPDRCLSYDEDKYGSGTHYEAPCGVCAYEKKFLCVGRIDDTPPNLDCGPGKYVGALRAMEGEKQWTNEKVEMICPGPAAEPAFYNVGKPAP